MNSNSKWIYYTRISTAQKQKMDRQLENSELIAFCQRMGISRAEIKDVSDVATGKNFDRTGFQMMKQFLREGDCLIVSSLDRFGRNYIQGKKEFTELLNMGVKVYVLNRPMLEDLYKMADSGNTMGKFMIDFIINWELATAEEELQKIQERQREGIEVAKAKGQHLGRPKRSFPEGWDKAYREWKNDKITAVEVMRRLDIKKTTFYRLVKDQERVEN